MLPSEPTKTEVSLQVNGAIYSNWKNVSIHQSLYSISGSFDLNVTGIAQDSKVIVPLQAGDACVVLLGKEPLITGYIDTVSKMLDATQKSISISGRDKTGDLVDCSALASKLTWQNAPFLKIAQDLVEAFNIPILLEADAGALFPAWHIEPGESVFNCLERAAKSRGLLLTSNGKGELVVTKAKAGSAQASLKEGVNLLSMASTQDIKSRFKTYQVQSHLPLELGYQMGSGFTVQAEATDKEIKRTRTLCINADGIADKSLVQKRAEWEMEVRRAKSHKLTLIVQGFRSSLGAIWKCGDSVQVESEFLGLKHPFLITSVQFQFNEQGKRTTLEVESLDAIRPDPTTQNAQNPYLKLLERDK